MKRLLRSRSLLTAFWFAVASYSSHLPLPRGPRRDGEGRGRPERGPGEDEGALQDQPVQPDGQRHDRPQQEPARRPAGWVSEAVGDGQTLRHLTTWQDGHPQ